MLQPGELIGGCLVERLLGRGGMASVYLAFQPNLNRHVAIKVLPAFLAEEPGFRERFQQEAQAVARLRHPHILVVFDYGEEHGIVYLIGEYLENGTLADQLGDPVPPAEAARQLAPIAAALDYAHAHGIVHRDVKPSNVLINADGAPVLSDFGMARVLDSRRLTETGMMLGTPEYMAPEMATDSAVGPSVDHYALAVMAYELLTGSVPFTGTSPQAVLVAHMQQPVPPPRERNSALSTSVEVVLLKGLAKLPADRYPSASAFVTALETAATAPPAPEQPVAEQPSAAAPGAGGRTLRIRNRAAGRSENWITRALQPGTSAPSRVLRAGGVIARSWRLPLAVLLLAALGAAGIELKVHLAPSGSPTVRPSVWTAVAQPPVAVSLAQTAALTDGAALVLGGYGTNGTSASVDAYDPRTAHWRQLPSMHLARSQFAVAVLIGGSVLVAGGDTGSAITAGVELLDSRGRAWSMLAPLRTPRRSASVVRLHSGMVLLAGGEDDRYRPLTSSELFDPRTRRWQATGATATAHYGSAAVLLADGRVLLAGGGTAACELYDPASGQWSAAASLHVARLYHTLTVLHDGRVLAAGGADAGDQQDQRSAEIYDPVTNNWTPIGPMRLPRSRQTAALLDNGSVLVAGGRSGKAVLAESELYDPITARWSSGPALHARRSDAAMVGLAGGQVLVAGGGSGPGVIAASAELFSPRGVEYAASAAPSLDFKR